MKGGCSINRFLLSVCLVFTVSNYSNDNCVAANFAPAYAGGVTETQPDGTEVNLYLKGHVRNGAVFQTDEQGHPVLRNDEGWFVYADYEDKGLAYTPSKRRQLSYSLNKLGVDDPPSHEPPAMQSLILPDKNNSTIAEVTDNDVIMHVQDYLCEGTEQSRWCPNSSGEPAAPLGRTSALGRGSTIIPEDLGGQLNLIVLLVKFSDQATRNLPSREDYDVLFNGGDAATLQSTKQNIIPSGSVQDYFTVQSAGKWLVTAHVQDWIVANNTEEFWSFGNNGAVYEYPECAFPALNRMDADPSTDWSIFDRDNVSHEPSSSCTN